MKWAARIAQVLVGLMFLVFGANYFLKLIPIPAPPTPEAGAFLQTLDGSGYLTVVKVIEIAGGALLLSGRFTPLGVVLLAPVALNIALYELCLVKGPGPGVVLTGLLAVVVAGHWPAFRGLLTMTNDPSMTSQ